MSLILKSNLYREELKSVLLFTSLTLWALLASYFALKNNSQTLLIAISENGTELITTSNEKIIKSERLSFLKTFLQNYYTYNQQNFSEKMEASSNMMSQTLWEKLKPSILELKDKLSKTELTQISELESLDQTQENTFEAILNLKITTKINTQSLKLKVFLKTSAHTRSKENPYNLEISEIKDAPL